MISPREQGFMPDPLQPMPPGIAQPGYPPVSQGIGPLPGVLQSGQAFAPPYLPPPMQLAPMQFSPGGPFASPGLQGMPGFMPQAPLGPGFDQPQQWMSPPGFGPLPAGDQMVGRWGNDVSRQRQGPKNYTRSDERIRELICERLIQDLSLDVGDVEVDVKKGRVTLAGSVPDRRMRHAIEDVVDGCWGVLDIENGIRVSSTPEATVAAAGPQAARSPVAQTGGGFVGSSGGSGKPSTEPKGKAREE